MEVIEAGAIYRIHHSNKLTPPSLSAIKAVLVDKKSNGEVTMVFPSEESLKTFFSDEKRYGLMQPNLDEKMALDLNVCQKFLIEKIPFEEFASQRGTRSFWAVDLLDHQDAGMEIKWGASRRRATFFGDRRTRSSILPCAVLKSFNEQKDEDDDEDNAMDEDEYEKEIKPEKTRKVKKRKCQFKGVKYTEKKKKNPINSPHHRWTNERYKLAEKNMFNIMKAKGAVPGNPILRPDLRSEARKSIGDTGLLDHILKHMTGKLAPAGGKERFRRRHNPEGAMEYWLESADMVEIRKKAGVKDTYWVPPSGWIPGDSPTQDPICARELKVLKEDVDNMKRDVGKVACKSAEEANNDKALMPDPFGRLDVEASLKPLKDLYSELMKKRASVENQLFDLSKSFSGMEEEIGINVKEVKRCGKAVVIVGSDENMKETKGLSEYAEKDNRIEDAVGVAVVLMNEKQERRERLKSGFKICKPQGTFLWPTPISNSNSNSQLQYSTSTYSSLEDILGYPTPPSVSSSSNSSSRPLMIFGHHRQEVALVKRPVAKRVGGGGGHATIDQSAISSSSTSTITTHVSTPRYVPDLNEDPPLSIISSDY